VFFTSSSSQPGRCESLEAAPAARANGNRVNRTIFTKLGTELHMLVVWRKTGERRGRIAVDPREAGGATMILRRTVRTADCRSATGLMRPTKTASRRFAPRSDGCVS
jgi:hypothetical protein